jgi:hypothetical protein
LFVALCGGLASSAGWLAFRPASKQAEPERDNSSTPRQEEFRPLTDQEMPVLLGNARIGNRFGQTLFQVDYQLRRGSLPPAERYVWVVMSPLGLVHSQPIATAEIRPRGTLKANRFISAPLLRGGGMETFLALEPPGAKTGQLQRISNIVPVR